jgi:hypothetical protein
MASKITKAQRAKANNVSSPGSQSSTQLQKPTDTATAGHPDQSSTHAQGMRQEEGGLVLMLDVDKAMEEITRVPAAVIHRDAAYAWASRAIASYRVSMGKSSMEEGLSYLYLGEHYREAALAHATMGEVWEFLFTEIIDAMAMEREQAFANVRTLSSGATR